MPGDSLSFPVTFEQQIRHVLERALTDLREHLEADLSRFAQDLMRVAGEERHRATVAAADSAIASVRRQADAEVAELRRGFEQQLEELGRSTQQQLEEARRAAPPELDEVRRHLTAELETTRRKLEEQLEEAQALARAQIERARLDLEEAKRAAHAEAEEAASAQVAIARADIDRTTVEAVDRGRAEVLHAEREAHARLVKAIRSLDEADSLGGVLDRLLDAAAGEADRAAVMIVKGERLRGWRFAGFADAGSPTSVDLDLDASGIPGVVARTGAPVSRFIPDTDHGLDTGGPGLPSFAAGAGARQATAVPIIVGQHVVGVLYADVPRLDTPSASSRWPEVLDVLARHASRVLEAMTVERATGLSGAQQVARASHTAGPGPVAGGEGGHFDAA
jgi:hypothetical protein